MRLLIAGGGTGGHLYPGLAIADELKRLEPSSSVLFIGTRGGIEQRVVPGRGYRIRYIAIAGFLGKSRLKQALFPIQFLAALIQSIFLILAFHPDAVLGTGGYVSAPPVLAAWLLRVPVGLLALDAMPSKAVRMLAGCADEIYSGFLECADFLKPKHKVFFTGNPLRGEIGAASRPDGAKAFKLDPGKKTVLLFGGSQGAHSLNHALLDALTIKMSDQRWQNAQFIIQTGKRDHEDIKKKLSSLPYKMTVLPYIDDMPLAYAAADMVVSRSGAGVSEVLACGLPAILVPYPHAASNHQEYNARSLEKAGAAVVIMDANLNGPVLAETIDKMLFDPARLDSMAKAAKTLARPGAAADITNRLINLAKK
jgi:UDP-N-acetylglucosamine--N-acetylmuramyl-(pentapeptide) pyrophosphoryl-undecaprenol N-acetylglucosamine transferase